jgi:hypothetical protein
VSFLFGGYLYHLTQIWVVFKKILQSIIHISKLANVEILYVNFNMLGLELNLREDKSIAIPEDPLNLAG